MHTETETRWGLKLVGWSLLLNLSAIVASALVVLTLRVTLSRGPGFWAYFPVFSFSAWFLSVASGILFLLAFSTMYRHRGESGLIRDRQMRTSLFLLVGTITALVGWFSVSLFVPFLLILSSGPGGVQALLVLTSLISRGVAILVALLLALLLYYMVVSLVPSRLLSRLKLAVVLFVLSAIAAFGLALASMWTDLPLQEFNEVFVAPSALAVLLFWSVYRASQRPLDLPTSQSLST